MGTTWPDGGRRLEKCVLLCQHPMASTLYLSDKLVIIYQHKLFLASSILFETIDELLCPVQNISIWYHFHQHDSTCHPHPPPPPHTHTINGTHPLSILSFYPSHMFWHARMHWVGSWRISGWAWQQHSFHICTRSSSYSSAHFCGSPSFSLP